MEHTIRFLVLALVGAFGGIAGCSAGDGGGASGEPGARMQIQEDCEATECELRTDDDSYACESCLDACYSASYACDSSSACSLSCAPSEPCDASEDVCVIASYEVVLPNNPDPEVEAACLRSVAHIEGCGYESSATAADCRVFAAVEKPDVISLYDCVSKLSCEELMNPQAFEACLPAPSSFGTELCSTIDDVCGLEDWCGDEWKAELNAAGAVLREDAKDAAFWCTEQGCDGGRKCIWAWRHVVLGTTP